MNKHTPEPLHTEDNGAGIIYLVGGGKRIATIHSLEDGLHNAERRQEAEANAEFIVRACNAYEELLRAAKRALHDIGELTDFVDEYDPTYLRKAIAKAEGRDKP